MARTNITSVVAFCLILAAVCSARQIKRSPKAITYGPLNVAVFQGATVAFECASTLGDRVQWHEYATNPSGALVSDGNLLLPGHPNFLRYSLNFNDTEDPSWYNLTITPTVVEDGGRYQCLDATTSTTQSAELIIIDSAPNCTTTLPYDGFVVEGVYYTIECTLWFRASLGIAPVMSWTGSGNFNQIYRAYNDSVFSGIAFTVQRAMDGKAFRMLVNFTQDNFGGENAASNVPTWSYVWQSQQIFVMWGPTNITYYPIKASYEIGEVLTCWSDAYPLATYKWTNMGDLSETDAQTLTLTEANVGTTIFRCQAVNAYGSANLFTNITVNARTTTGPSTTPEPTTTVAPVANCDDLTGRWEFQRSADSLAVLCLYVNRTNGGTLTGLLWNDTKTEAYYMEIFGRTRNNIFDETGFTGIWPLDVGVSAFAAECHKCYGVESLLVNLISRSSKDGEFCGDGGNLLDSPQYSFSRVPTSYPCASSAAAMRAISKQATAELRKRRSLSSLY